MVSDFWHSPDSNLNRTRQMEQNALNFNPRNPENKVVKKMPVEKKPGKILVLQTSFLSNSVWTGESSWQRCKVCCFARGNLWCVSLFRGEQRSWAFCVFPKLLSKPTGNIVKASFVQRRAFAAVLCCPLSVQMPPGTEGTTISLAAAVLPGASTSSSWFFGLLRCWLAAQSSTQPSQKVE